MSAGMSLEPWHDYFFMIGSSAAALIGLMFVVVTLTAGRDRNELERGKKLYTSPIVMHLAVVLVLSGGAIAPPLGADLFGISSAAVGVIGAAICTRNAVGISRTRISGADNTSFDTWWYGVAPALVYAALAAGAAGLLATRAWGVDLVSAAILALLLVSIHAEWDLVTYLAPDAPTANENSRK